LQSAASFVPVCLPNPDVTSGSFVTADAAAAAVDVVVVIGEHVFGAMKLSVQRRAAAEARSIGSAVVVARDWPSQASVRHETRMPACRLPPGPAAASTTCFG
jgi:hypothetical protein